PQASTWQLALQPSHETVLPSSHCSPGSKLPSPQAEVGAGQGGSVASTVGITGGVTHPLIVGGIPGSRYALVFVDGGVGSRLPRMVALPPTLIAFPKPIPPNPPCVTIWLDLLTVTLQPTSVIRPPTLTVPPRARTTSFVTTSRPSRSMVPALLFALVPSAVIMAPAVTVPSPCAEMSPPPHDPPLASICTRMMSRPALTSSSPPHASMPLPRSVIFCVCVKLPPAVEENVPAFPSGNPLVTSTCPLTTTSWLASISTSPPLPPPSAVDPASVPPIFASSGAVPPAEMNPVPPSPERPAPLAITPPRTITSPDAVTSSSPAPNSPPDMSTGWATSILPPSASTLMKPPLPSEPPSADSGPE